MFSATNLFQNILIWFLFVSSEYNNNQQSASMKNYKCTKTNDLGVQVSQIHMHQHCWWFNNNNNNKVSERERWKKRKRCKPFWIWFQIRNALMNFIAKNVINSKVIKWERLSHLKRCNFKTMCTICAVAAIHVFFFTFLVYSLKKVHVPQIITIFAL